LPIYNPEANSAAKARLIAALQQGRLIGMTGAGLSAWAGYPVWNRALRRLADLVAEITGERQHGDEVIAQNMDMLFCAQKLGQIIGPDEFSRFLVREFGPNAKVSPNVLLHFALLRLRHIVTLNFDPSCEEAHAAAGVPYRSLSSANNEVLVEFFREMDIQGCEKTIFHLHGRFNDPLDKIALTEVGYQRLYSEGALFPHHFRNLVVAKSLLFCGFGFADYDVVEMLYRMARQVRAQLNNRPVLFHFAIIGLRNETDQHNDDRARRQHMSDRYLTDAIFYNVRDGDDPHAEFAELMRELSEACGHAALPQLPGAAPAAEIVALEDIQRMESLSAGFLRRVGQNHEND